MLVRSSASFGMAVAALILLAAPVKGDLLGPSPYLSFAASPFNGMSFQYFHLETFEDGLLNVPGVSAVSGSVVAPSIQTDSVDADDGVIDGLGRNGHSFFNGDLFAGVRFNFSASALGSLPTHVGIVWTDTGLGAADVIFEAFGPSGLLIATITAPALSDFSLLGTTAEDRFFGVIDAGGVSGIRVRSSGGVGIGGFGIEVDHLQYGSVQPVGVIPEPAGVILFGLGALGLLGYAWRRRKARA